MYKRDETGKSKQDNEKHRVKWKKHGSVECFLYISWGFFITSFLLLQLKYMLSFFYFNFFNIYSKYIFFLLMSQNFIKTYFFSLLQSNRIWGW